VTTTTASPSPPAPPTVAYTVNDWLDHGLGGCDPATVRTLRILAQLHVIPALGSRKLHDLSAEDVDRWLAAKAPTLSTSSLARIKSILARSISRAQARDKVKRNVVLLCETPTGQAGRPSKSLTLDQAQALLDAATGTTIGAYVTASLLTGARTEELRALTWSHVDLDGDPVPIPPCYPTCGYGARSARAATARRGRRGEPSRFPNARSRPSASNATGKPMRVDARDHGGSTTISCSRRKQAPPLTQPTSGAASEASPPPPDSTPTPGRRGS
jgi:hypothetical protein